MNPRLLTLLATLLLFTGCAQLPSLPPAPGQDAEARLEQLLEKERYAAALELIDASEAEALRGRRPQVEAAAEEYRRQVLAEAAALTAARAWSRAEALYRGALENLDGDPEVRQAQEAFQSQRARYAEQLRLRLLILDAEHQRRTLPLKESLRNAAPAPLFGGFRLTDERGQLRESAQKLLEGGREALGAGNLELAAEALTLADQIASSEATREALVELQRQQRHQSARAERLRQQAQAAITAKQRDEALAACRRSLAESRLSEARRQIQRLEHDFPADTEIRQLARSIDAAVASEVKRLQSAAQHAYSSGDFDAAIANWKRVLELAPDNTDARVNLERAQRVQQRLQELQQP